MLRFLAHISRTSPSLISSYLKDVCYGSRNEHGHYLRNVYDGILKPCLKERSHYLSEFDGKPRTVTVVYHDHSQINISDYFSALGYVLAHKGSHHSPLDFTYLLQTLTVYAEWSRVSSTLLNVNPPTVVQLLWVESKSWRYPLLNDTSPDGRFSLSSSVSAGKGPGREEVREERVKTLSGAWSRPLPNPTPVQEGHFNSGIISSAELFGTPWGHCGESVTFASMFKAIQAGVPLGTLALSVKAMTSVIPGTDVVPVDAIPKLSRLDDIVEVLRVSGALRPMCLNCQYLAAGRIEDYAYKFSAPMA